MKKVLILGGGVVGLFTAYYLRRAGHKVTIADKHDFSNSCSYGNAGLLVPSHVTPLAAPGLLPTVWKQYFDAAAPLTFRVPPPPGFIQWAWRFMHAANRAHVTQAAPVLKALSLLSLSLYQDLAAQPDWPAQIDRKGLLMICRGKDTLHEEVEAGKLAQAVGLEAKTLSADDLYAMEPSLAKDLAGAVYYPGDASLDPGEWMMTLCLHLRQQGVEFIKDTQVQTIEKNRDKVTRVVLKDRSPEFDDVVITAGVWSNDLLKWVGRKVPLQPGRGYSMNLPGHQGIRYPALLIDARVAVTPFPTESIRFAGGMELGYFNNNIFQKRLDRIKQSVVSFYPGVSTDALNQAAVWQGHRPCSFDGLPYIGRVPGLDNLYVGTGHAMMGVTLAPATGKLLTDLISGQKPVLNAEPFRINR